MGEAVVFAVAGAVVLLHLFTNSRYGLHRDELQFLSDSRQLDWGFVAYPPLTAFAERVSFSLFGLSLVGLRLFSVLAQATAVVFSGWMARDFGGGRIAQFTTALSVALSPLPLFEGTEFQYSTFDYLWWVLASYSLLRLLRSGNPRWWLAVGAALGLGLETKYSILFLIAAIVGGLLLTGARRQMLSGWFWAGVALCLAIFLPNFLWLSHHDFISYQFLQHIHARDVRQGRADGFLRDQFLICANLFATPLWVAGLVAFFASRRFRLMAWVYSIAFLLFFFAKGRGYYLAGAYPPLLAMGCVVWERWLSSLSTGWRRAVASFTLAGITAIGAYACVVIVPLAASGPLRDFALSRNGDLREELGWQQMVASIAHVRDSLSSAEQAHLGIVVGNYGERGAVDLYGPAYRLPAAIAGTNSGWLNSYPHPEPTTVIVLGVANQDRESEFTDCRLAERIPYPRGQNNEESNDHSEIYLCGAPRLPWPELWKMALSFG